MFPPQWWGLRRESEPGLRQSEQVRWRRRLLRSGTQMPSLCTANGVLPLACIGAVNGHNGPVVREYLGLDGTGDEHRFDSEAMPGLIFGPMSRTA